MLIEGLISEIIDFSGEIFFSGTVLKDREAQKKEIFRTVPCFPFILEC
jgi:hypothetical protein